MPYLNLAHLVSVLMFAETAQEGLDSLKDNGNKKKL
jgi:hypothetical protein